MNWYSIYVWMECVGWGMWGRGIGEREEKNKWYISVLLVYCEC